MCEWRRLTDAELGEKLARGAQMQASSHHTAVRHHTEVPPIVDTDHHRDERHRAERIRSMGGHSRRGSSDRRAL